MNQENKTLKMVLCISILILIMLSTPGVLAESNNITIIEPSNDNSTFSSNFDVIVFINDTLAKSAQVRMIGYPWLPLEQSTSTSWGTTINISNYPDGPGELSAKYLRNGEVIWNYVPTTTTIIIKNPAPVIITGSLQATIKDYLGNPLADVLVTPSGNKTDANGIVKIGNLSLNTEINFTFSKNGFNNSYFVYTFTNNNLVSQALTLNNLAGNVKKLKVSGYNEIAEAGTMFNLKVIDEATGETVNGADVKIYNQNEVVASIPGTTTAKGRITASFTQPGSYYLGVEKIGFADWESDEIQILASKTATPSPTPNQTSTGTPTPVPTPADTSKFREDANMKLTDDEYRVWMQNEEKRKADLNLSSQSQTNYSPPPQQGSSGPWAVIGLIGIVVGAIGWKYTKKKRKNDAEFEETDDPDLLELPGGITLPGKEASTEEIKDSKEILHCEFCEWTTEVGNNMSRSMKRALIDLHCQEENHGKPTKNDPTIKAVVAE